jgi:hypothetical protein
MDTQRHRGTLEPHHRMGLPLVSHTFTIGQRVGIATGNLVGCYGHVSDRVIMPTGELADMVAVAIQGTTIPATERFIGEEWFIPTQRLSYID